MSARILVVDDEPPIRKLLGRLLTSAGYEAVLAADVADASAALEREAFELVLADVSMPGQTGFDLLADARHRFPDMAALMISALDDPRFAERAIELGAYGYILKPFERNEVLIAVMNALRRRSLEIAARAHQDELEALVRARTAELEQQLRIQSEFVTIASHELRTPLSVVKGYAKILLTPSFAVDERERHGYLERLYEACDRLSRLVESFLDSARIESGQAPLRQDRVRLRGVLRQLVPVLNDRYGRRPVLPPGDLVVRADPVAVERILLNLLDNAFKYAESDDPPLVRWRLPPGSGHAGVEIANAGSPISDDERTRLFHRFGRLPRHASQPGTGLGLYSARALVERMGGHMGVSWQDGQVTFWFELPA